MDARDVALPIDLHVALIRRRNVQRLTGIRDVATDSVAE